VTKTPSRRLLFVCTGNTCRSPIAQFLARRLAREAGLAWEAESAGIAASPGAPLSEGAARVLAARGISKVRHDARTLDEHLLSQADAVYALAREHRREIVERFPARAAKVSVLREAAGLPDADVTDPIGGDDAAYEECAGRIEEALKILIRRSPHAEPSR